MINKLNFGGFTRLYRESHVKKGKCKDARFVPHSHEEQKKGKRLL